jgi:3-dehydroquinate synthetase
MRGIDFYQVPTTLLAMVDSSVGGKTGINIPEGKNLVGAFHQPKAVFIDVEYLDTLPEREFSAGMAEVIKYGLLGDKKFFEMIEGLEEPLTPGHQKMSSVIAHCCKMKADVVASDERETAKDGGRALLNLGHTFAHAIEKCAGYGEYLHGEAVGLGLLLAARLSHSMGEMDAGDIVRIEKVLTRYRLPVKLRKPISIEDLISAIKVDKKTISGLPRFVVMRGIGVSIVRDDIPLGLAKDVFATAL